MSAPGAPLAPGWRPLIPLALAGAAILALTAAAPFVAPRLQPALGDLPMLGQALACGVLALLAAGLAARGDPPRAMAVILGVAVLARLALLPHIPVQSVDVYRYVWDGRVAAAGFNPYLHVPSDPLLAPLRDVVYDWTDKKDHATALYPPAAQLFFLAVTRLGESQLVLRLAMVAMEGLTLWAIVGLLSRLGRPPTDAVAYAWHPLALWEIAGNGHLDGAMTALAMAGTLLALRGRGLLGGAVITVGALFKPFALLMLPALWRPWNVRLPLIVAGVAVALYLPYVAGTRWSGAGWPGAGGKVFGFLATYLAEERIGGDGALWPVAALGALLGAAGLADPLGFVDPLRLAKPLYYGLAALGIGALALRAGFRRERSALATVADSGALVLAFLLLLQPRYAWYFLLALPFAALLGWRHPVGAGAGAAAAAAFGLYAVVLPSGAGGAMAESALEARQVALTAAVILAIMMGLWRRRTAGRPAPAPPHRTPA